MRVVLVAKPGNTATGVGRYVQMLYDGLRREGLEVRRISPSAPSVSSRAYSAFRYLHLDLQAFLLNYPVWARYPGADVYHLTSQNLASLLLFRPPQGKVLVTVHDIIPYMLRNDPALCSYRTVADRLFDRLAMLGLRRADRLIADSHYTKRCVVEYLKIAPDRVDTVHLGIDRRRFRPLPVPAEIRARYGLPEGRRYLIYVGSEDPRKNLGTLVRALAELRRELSDLELIKVGRPHFDPERRRLAMLAEQLGIRPAIHFLDDVSEKDLPVLYSLADVCVMPSLYEGFGFPALEAMACGTPLVCARAASLPEIVGDAGIIVNCGSPGAGELAEGLRHVLTDNIRREELRASGLARAARFDWRDMVCQAINLYDGRRGARVDVARATKGCGAATTADPIGGMT